MASKRVQTFWDELFSEHIHMPGFPQLIVTRARARRWFKEIGWNLDQRTPEGQSVDRMVFLPAALDEPLTDEETCEYWLAQMAEREKER